MALRYFMHRRIGMLLACLIAAMSLAIACGDDDGPSDSTGPAPPTSSASPDVTGTAAPTSTDEATPVPTVGGVSGELRSLIDGWFDGVNAKVTYDYASNFGGHPEGVYTTYYLDGADRHDWENIGAGLGVTLTTIVNGDDAYVCNIFESNPTCNVRTVQDTLDTRVSFLIIPRTLQTISDRINTLAIRALPDEVIAGTDAKCYETTTTGERITEGPPAVEVVVTCFSADSILLRVDHDVLFEDGEDLPDGDLLLEATEVGQAVPSDFEPPARVIGG